jgi:hypothetical protein
VKVYTPEAQMAHALHLVCAQLVFFNGGEAMKSVFVGSTCMVALMMSASVFAQATQAPAEPATPAPSPAAQARQVDAEAPGRQVTVVGCVQREADYRQARDAGKGGVLGSGVGVGNEFILVAASMSGSSASGASTPGAVGTAGGASASMGTDYELTGANEGRVGEHVGKRVEIVGRLKEADMTPAGPSGGPTAGQPPAGVDVTSKDLKLHEIEVVSVREASGTCPAAR